MPVKQTKPLPLSFAARSRSKRPRRSPSFDVVERICDGGFFRPRFSPRDFRRRPLPTGAPSWGRFGMFRSRSLLLLVRSGGLAVQFGGFIPEAAHLRLDDDRCPRPLFFFAPISLLILLRSACNCWRRVPACGARRRFQGWRRSANGSRRRACGEAGFDEIGVFADETDVEHPMKLAKSISKRKTKFIGLPAPMNSAQPGSPRKKNAS